MNWEQRIEAARERGCFEQEDCDAARDWRTCFIGKYVGAEPWLLHDVARDLGQRFYEAVLRNDVEAAVQVRAEALRIHFCKQCSEIIDWEGEDTCSNCKG